MWLKRSITLSILLCLFGCGFKPLYSSNFEGDVANELGKVRVSVIEDREGQLLRNYLLQRIDTLKNGQSPQYTLDIKITKTSFAIAVREDATATRKNMKLIARFSLYDLKTGKLLHKGSSVSINSYRQDDAPFVTMTSEEDAKRRNIKNLAQDILLRLSSYFNEIKVNDQK